MGTKPSKQDQIAHEQEYVAFLEKRLASQHFKDNTSTAVFEMTERKLKKARLVLKLLKS
jgi:hypothetical protein